MNPSKKTFHSPRSGDTLITVCKAQPPLTDGNCISSTPQQAVCKAQPPLTDDSCISSTPQQAVCKAQPPLTADSHKPSTPPQTACKTTSHPEPPYPATPLEDWLDPQDVMQQLHISPRTLQTLRSNGTLPFAKLKGKIYYKKQDLEKILNDNYKTMENGK